MTDIAPHSRPSCWLFADNTIDLGNNANRVGSFDAYLKHALLFHERILIPDSNIVNTVNVRLVAQKDPELTEYLASECLVIASRSEGGRNLTLEAVRDGLAQAPGTMNVGFDQNPQLFRENVDLRRLQQSATVQYDVEDSRRYYTEAIKAFLSDPMFLETLGSDAQQMSTLISEEIAKRGFLRQRFFEPRVAESLPSLIGEEKWNRYGAFIREHEMAYYRNAIPVQVGADVIFSREHEVYRKILRRIGASDKGDGYVSRVDLSRGGKSLYEALLSTISVQSLREIRTSGPFSEFQGALVRLQQIKDINDQQLPSSIEATSSALVEYHKSIDKRLAWTRVLASTSALLDDWHLRGFLNGGAWALRIGAEQVANPALRVYVATTLADLLDMHTNSDHVAKTAVGVWFAQGGLGTEAWMNKIPLRLKAMDDKKSLRSQSRDPVKAYIATSPLLKDTQYS